MKYKVLNTWNKGDDVYVSYHEGGTNKRETLKVNTIWYFIIETKDLEKVKKLIDRYCGTSYPIKESDIEGYTKIFIKDQWLRSIDKYDLVCLIEKAGIQTFEGDLLPNKRWYIDKDLEISDTYSKLYFDIETDDTKNIINVGQDRII